jgi:hypothetical protein
MAASSSIRESCPASRLPRSIVASIWQAALEMPQLFRANARREDAWINGG